MTNKIEALRNGLRLFRTISPQIRASQIDMLLTIALKPGISQTELAVECDLTLSAVSRAVDLTPKGIQLINLYQEISNGGQV